MKMKSTVSILLAMIIRTVLALPTDTAPTTNKYPPSNCPLYLVANTYEYPHLIVPISAAAPDAILGNSFTPSISPNDLATIFNFDIPASRAGQTCSLYFTFPTQSQLVTTTFTFSGPGTFQFAQYQPNDIATSKTTWRNQPGLSSLPPVMLTGVSPGHSYKLWTGKCGQAGSLSWRMESRDSCLWYFQDFNDCAIGLYIVYS